MRMRKPSPQILLNYGMILHALDRSEEALASFDAALKQKSKFAEAHNAVRFWRDSDATRRRLNASARLSLVAIATRLGQDLQYRKTISARMAENRHKLYRDRAPITALEDFLESAVRG
jgi:hypothetical protein